MKFIIPRISFLSLASLYELELITFAEMKTIFSKSHERKAETNKKENVNLHLKREFSFFAHFFGAPFTRPRYHGAEFFLSH